MVPNLLIEVIVSFVCDLLRSREIEKKKHVWNLTNIWRLGQAVNPKFSIGTSDELLPKFKKY